MRREEILRSFEVASGIIRSPGKFEGEPVWAPYFWEMLLDGIADEEDDGEVVTFHVTDADRAEFPELAEIAVIRMWERQDGFVCSESS
jgi:hypothetical protein